ncbi:ATP-dependent DNA helicase PIF1-like [Haliotis cracherodii]|uniref:ATP-dependent DNA helicase PIF1-like n=1 Tax=Haliotis cracherodii TaxID=6455 RepID=UPI0039E8EF76
MYDDDCRRYKDNILNTDILLLDEISMLSAKLFLQIEHLCRYVRKCDMPYGGMQVIAAGDFNQLKPVPNKDYNDPGHLVISHPDIKRLFPHHFVLKDVHRQSQVDLIQAVNELGRGEISKESADLLRRLKRSLPPGPEPVRLFAHHYDVEKCNSDHLMDMAGDDHIFRSTDTGNPDELSKMTAPGELHLKIGAPVILTANLSDSLVNGLRGVVHKIQQDFITVLFQDGKIIKIHRYTFSVFNQLMKRNVATRKQFPLKLAFALTVHKSQGLSLDRVEVDCSEMNVPGQIGVAIGRATNKKGLRVINFHPRLVTRQP